MATLNFKGKPFVQNYHLSVKYHQFIPRKNKSLTKKVSLHDNLIIHGDNLKALKALLPTYAGKIKCIYIDPPYNTGNEKWAYNDNVNSPMIQDWLGKVVDREDLTRHDKWLCMMTPRLKLLRELLSEDGVIFVSIDDHEVQNLRLLMDEVFGEYNFVAEFVWEGALKNDSRFVSISHDYILCYTRSKEYLTGNDTIWRTRKRGIDEIYQKLEEIKAQFGDDYEHITQSLKEWYIALPKNHSAWAHRHYNRVDHQGVYFAGDISWPGGGGPTYTVLHPKTKKPVTIPSSGWRFSTPERMEQAVIEDRVEFGEDETKVPTVKRYLKEIEGQVLPSVIYKDRRAAMQRLRQIMGKDVFENPKDEEILMRLMEATTSGNNIILDSFSGSGTTAHAVLALNKEDGGNRKFILVECEDYADKITAERVRRVIKGVPKAKDENLRKGLGGTFSYFELGPPIEMESILSGDNFPSYMELARYVFYTATGEEFDPDAVDEKKNFIGQSAQYLVYLFYKPDMDYLKATALTLDRAKALGPYKKKRRLVFAPTKYLDQEHLDELRIDFAQLPFEIYQLVK